MSAYRNSRGCIDHLEAVSRLSLRFPALDLIFVESAGYLAATFSPELSDLTLT